MSRSREVSLTPLPKGTTVLLDDTTYTAVALADMLVSDTAEGVFEARQAQLADGSVIVVNQRGEMLALPIADVLFRGLA